MTSEQENKDKYECTAVGLGTLPSLAHMNICFGF